MKKKLFGPFAALILSVSGCATVHVTKTGIGFHEPTIPDKVDILMTIPERKFVELATVASSNWQLHQTAKMHNSMRTKSAPPRCKRSCHFGFRSSRARPQCQNVDYRRGDTLHRLRRSQTTGGPHSGMAEERVLVFSLAFLDVSADISQPGFAS